MPLGVVAPLLRCGLADPAHTNIGPRCAEMRPDLAGKELQRIAVRKPTRPADKSSAGATGAARTKFVRVHTIRNHCHTRRRHELLQEDAILLRHGYELFRPDESGALHALADLDFGEDVFAVLSADRQVAP